MSSAEDVRKAESLADAMDDQLRRTCILLNGFHILLRREAERDPDRHSLHKAYYNLVKYIDYSIHYLEEPLKAYPCKDREEQYELMVLMETLVDEAHTTATALHRIAQLAGPEDYHYACLAEATESGIWSLAGCLFNLSDGTGIYTTAPTAEKPADEGAP